MKKIYILVNVIAFIWMSGGGVVWAQQTLLGTIIDENENIDASVNANR